VVAFLAICHSRQCVDFICSKLQHKTSINDLYSTTTYHHLVIITRVQSLDNWCVKYLFQTKHIQCESKEIPPEIFLHFFPNGWEFVVQILHTYYTFLSTLDYKFLFNYLQLWLSSAILSATTQFPSYAQCPPSAETYAFRCLRKSLIALLIIVCGKSSQIYCSALFSSGMVFGFDWSLWNAWSITHHTW